MEENSKPKPQPGRGHAHRTASVLEPVAELAVEGVKMAHESGGPHVAGHDGMQLLLEIAKLADHLLAAPPAPKHHHAAEPVDPRRCVDPRKRILPR